MELQKFSDPPKETQRWIKCVINSTRNHIQERKMSSIAIISDFQGCPEGCNDPDSPLFNLSTRAQEMVSREFSQDSLIWRSIGKIAGCDDVPLAKLIKSE